MALIFCLIKKGREFNMLTKTVTYEDYNGVERTENFYFNLSKAKLMEMELGVDGGYAEFIKKIIDAKDTKQLIKLFKELVLTAYGVKDDSGKRFIQNAEVAAEFEQSPAYSEIFMELVTDDVKAAEFVTGIMPKDLSSQAQEAMKEQNFLASVTK